MPAKKISFKIKERLEDDNLDLSMSELEEVPVRDIAQIKKATSLDLSNNHLKSLGKNFATLTHLVKLDLSKNFLTVLPENFGDLVFLRHLDLYSNQLTHLPLTFGQLKNLKWLDLKNNPLMPAVADVAGPCLDNQQCQKCAKNVVFFFQNIQKQVEEEKERRLQQKRKQQEREAEIAAQNQKKEQKKKKKNSKSSSQVKEENGVKYTHSPPKQESTEGTHSSSASVETQRSHFNILSTVLWLLKTGLKLVFVVSVILMISFFGLYLLDEVAFHHAYAKLETFSTSIVNKLPPGIVERTTIVIETARPYAAELWYKVVIWSKEAWSASLAFYHWLWEKQAFQTIVATFQICAGAIFHLICEIYRTLDAQIPIYLDMVKKKLFS